MNKSPVTARPKRTPRPAIHDENLNSARNYRYGMSLPTSVDGFIRPSLSKQRPFRTLLDER